MIEIGNGINIGGDITMGDVSVFAVYFVEEDGTTFLTSETGQDFIEE